MVMFMHATLCLIKMISSVFGYLLLTKLQMSVGHSYAVKMKLIQLLGLVLLHLCYF